MSRPLANVGIPEVPFGLDLGLTDLLTWLRNTVLSLQAAMIPPAGVTNSRATALAGAVQIDFTRSDGDAYVLYRNTTPSINGAVRIDLGVGNTYVDDLGMGGVKRWYAIQAKKGSVEGALSPWLSQTTLALGTAVAPPAPPPATQTPFVDQETDSVAQQIPNKGGFLPL